MMKCVGGTVAHKYAHRVSQRKALVYNIHLHYVPEIDTQSFNKPHKILVHDPLALEVV